MIEEKEEREGGGKSGEGEGGRVEGKRETKDFG